MTLLELVLASAVLAVVLAALCQVYFLVSREWKNQANKQDAMVAASQACSELSRYIGQAVRIIPQDRFVSSDAIAVCLPADEAYNSYVPVWDGGIYDYRPGTWIIFYLSDLTGDYWTSGEILWAGTITDWNTFPDSIVPDASWSLANSETGRIAPVAAIMFTADWDGDVPAVIVEVVSTYHEGDSMQTILETRKECLRNAPDVVTGPY